MIKASRHLTLGPWNALEAAVLEQAMNALKLTAMDRANGRKPKELDSEALIL